MLFLNCDSKWSARTSVTLIPISVMIEKRLQMKEQWNIHQNVQLKDSRL